MLGTLKSDCFSSFVFVRNLILFCNLGFVLKRKDEKKNVQVESEMSQFYVVFVMNFLFLSGCAVCFRRSVSK